MARKLWRIALDADNVLETGVVEARAALWRHARPWYGEGRADATAAVDEEEE